MIFLALCNTCTQPYELRILPEDRPLLAQIADENGFVPCPRLCGGRINTSSEATIAAMAKATEKETVLLHAKELYQAANGMGLPDEHVRDPELVDSLLRANATVETVLQERDGKLYLHQLHLSSGQVLHLTAGIHGAEIYKITKRRKPDGSASAR